MTPHTADTDHHGPVCAAVPARGAAPVPARGAVTAGRGCAPLTGKRGIALAAAVDEDAVPGLCALLRSLALSNPDLCEDLILLQDPSAGRALSAESAASIRALHPRVTVRDVDAGRFDGYPPAGEGSHRYHALEAFGIRGYDTVVVLDPGTVVTGDLGPLLRRREGVAGHAAPGGVFAVQSEYLTDAFRARLDATARSGAFPLGGGAIAVLAAALGGEFTVLPGGAPCTADEDARRRHEMADAAFDAAYLALDAPGHHDLLVHYGTRHVARTGDVAAARKVASAQVAAGEYRAAADLLRTVRIPVDEAWPHEVFGQALMSVSRYEEARAQLLLAAAAPNRAASALGRLAEIAWVHGDDALAREHARDGLAMDPTHEACRVQLRRASDPLPSSKDRPNEQLAHVASYMPQRGNAGDRLLPESVRLAFRRETGPSRWHSVHAHRLFDDAALARVNARKGLVIGGGGLFAPDTAPNGTSGWQWNVSDGTLDRVDVPVVVYAVGFGAYDAYDGQAHGADRFRSSLAKLVEKSAFFGLRDHGSVERARALLPARLHDRVRFQPCPTTVTRQLVDGWQDSAVRDDTVLVNAAYDRAGPRFGHDYGHFLAQMAAAVRVLRRHAEVKCAAHTPDDERIAFDLRREHGISLPVLPLYGLGTAAVRETYARTRLVIGMRGHAGTIPFGCGTPIVGLISHPRTAYFLADVERPEWGVSVHDRHLAARLTERAVALLSDHAAAVADVLDRQRMLWDVTRANAAGLRAILGEPEPEPGPAKRTPRAITPRIG